MKIRRFALILFYVVAVSVFTASVPMNGSAKELDWSFDNEEFEARLLTDWLMQDVSDDKARVEIFNNSNGNELECAAVQRVIAELNEEGDDNVDALTQRLETLVTRATPGNDVQWLELYKDVCALRRELRLADVIEVAPRFVYTKHYVIGASHYAYTEDVTDEATPDYSQDKRDGGQLCLAEFMPDGSIRNEVLVETEHGTLRDPDVSWDGTKILFSMRKDFNEDDFHLYEYDMETKETRQITNGAGVADIEPIYQ